MIQVNIKPPIVIGLHDTTFWTKDGGVLLHVNLRSEQKGERDGVLEVD